MARSSRQDDRVLEDFHDAVATARGPALLFFDTGGLCVSANRRWHLLCGPHPDFDPVAGWIEAVHPADRASVTAALQRAIAVKGRAGIMFRLWPRGHDATTLRGAFEMQDAAGGLIAGAFAEQLVGSVTRAVNASERRAPAPPAVDESRIPTPPPPTPGVGGALPARLGEMFAALGETVVLFDRERRCTAFHPEPEGREYMGRRPEVLFPAHVASLMSRAMDASEPGRSPRGFEFSLADDADRRRWFEARIVTLDDGGFLIGLRDITTRVKDEAERRRFFELSQDLMVVLDRSGRIERLNPAFQRRLGWRNDEVQGRPLSDFAAPGHEESSHALLRDLAQGKTINHVHTRLRTRDDRGVDLEWNAVPDRLSGTVNAVARDVTERELVDAERRAIEALAGAVMRETPPEEILSLSAREAGRVMEARSAVVVRFAAEGPVAEGTWSAGGLSGGVEPEHMSAAEGDAVALVRRTGRTACVVRGPETPAALATPIVLAERTWGCLAVTTGPRGAGRDVERRLERLAGLLATAISAAVAQARLAARATHDGLTGLLNHATFQERFAAEVERSTRYERPLALAMIDLDEFKQVNDRFGHATGDILLAEFAERLGAMVRTEDVLARVGGEEFAWLMPETDIDRAWFAVERARRALGRMSFADIGRVTFSAGVADLAVAGSGPELYRAADSALYAAKLAGRDGCHRYSAEAATDTVRGEPAPQREQLAVVRALAGAVDARDPNTFAHSERVAHIAGLIAGELGWNDHRIALLREAALVHDVGKIGVPDVILFKPGPLTPEEHARAAEHAALGAQIVAGSLGDEQVAWIRGHHERVDGRGYPDGLSEADIPEGALILGLADAWDAMTAPRTYAEPRATDEALRECIRCVGSQFAEGVVAALEAVLLRDGDLALGARARTGKV